LLAAEGAAHQPWLLVRAVIGGAALAGFYLALWLIFPDQLGLGDVKLAASIGLVLAWGSWSELFAGGAGGGAPGRRIRAGAVGTARASRPGLAAAGAVSPGRCFRGHRAVITRR
jgi:hypothetical protein